MKNNVNLIERRDALIKRRGINLEDVKFRGKLQTVKWAVYEASQKQHLFERFSRSISEQ